MFFKQIRIIKQNRQRLNLQLGLVYPIVPYQLMAGKRFFGVQLATFKEAGKINNKHVLFAIKIPMVMNMRCM